MTDYNIECGIPIPSPQAKYPFALMEIGDSFAFPPKKRKSVSVAAVSYGAKHQRKFAIRQTGDICRCWRIASP